MARRAGNPLRLMRRRHLDALGQEIQDLQQGSCLEIEHVHALGRVGGGKRIEALEADVVRPRANPDPECLGQRLHLRRTGGVGVHPDHRLGAAPDQRPGGAARVGAVLEAFARRIDHVLARHARRGDRSTDDLLALAGAEDDHAFVLQGLQGLDPIDEAPEFRHIG